MARKPAAPTPSGGAESRPPDAARAAQHDESEGEHERFGPLTIERLRKDDGRALIIYSHPERREHGSRHGDRQQHGERDRHEGAGGDRP
jgi:hypothetical protein